MYLIERNDTKYLYSPNNNSELNPILELYRGKMYISLLKLFIHVCIEHLGKKIFCIKKSFPRTITNLLASWFFTLYSEYDFSEDPFFPNNYKNIESLKSTLNDFIKYDPSIKDSEKKINNILKNIIDKYESILLYISDYKKSSYYLERKNNYTINVKDLEQFRNKKSIFFKKFTIEYPFKIKDNRQENIINNILIPNYIYEKLKNNYNGPQGKMDEYIWIIIYRYQLLGSNNNQLGVLPNVLKKMQNDFGLNFECFASSINSTFNEYCSLYYDVEKYFGSKGSFFNLQPLKGAYGFNPPYQKSVMEDGIKKLFIHLEKATKLENDLTFIITIPIWDDIGKKMMKYIYPENSNTPVIDYEDFISIENILKSKFFKGKLMIPKDKFTYLDHNFHLYKNVTIQHTYILILSNRNIDFQSKINKYIFSENLSPVEIKC